MPRDSSGNYTLPAGNPVVTGTTISSSWGNATMGDIATEITDSLDRSGKGGMLAILKVFDGSVTTPGIGFASEPGTGIYRPAAQEWAVSISGVQELLISTTGITTAVGMVVNGSFTASTVSGTGIQNLTTGTTDSNLIATVGGSAALAMGVNLSGSTNIFGAPTGSAYISTAQNINLNIGTGGVIRAQVGAAGNVSINAPSSGVTLAVAGTAASEAFQINSGNSNATTTPDIYVVRGQSQANTVTTGASIELSDASVPTATTIQHSGGQTELWQFNGAWNQAWKVLTSRGFVINAPTSGRALAVTAFAGVHPIIMTDSTGSSGPLNVGYLEVPQNLQAGNYTCVLADSGKAIDMNGTGLTATIPANSAVAYPIGTCLTFTNLNASSLSIAITTDTLVRAGSTSTGTRTLLQNGMATARKVSATGWFISGTGLT